MSEDQGIRLVALIEEKGDYRNPAFKITNFLSDIKVVERKDGIEDTHLQDEKGRYLFDIIKPKNTQLPYTKTFKDLTVIVGENGAGKTSLINEIISGSPLYGKTYMIFQQKSNVWAYSTSKYLRISIPTEETYPNIIKFSNSEELYKLDLSFGFLRAIDASYIENFTLLANRSDAKQLALQEIRTQIQFVEEFQDDIKEFVDYTQKGIGIKLVNAKFDSRTRHIDVDMDTGNEYNIHQAYFSTLINYILDKEYYEADYKQVRRKKLLEEHFRYISDKDRISLQYNSINIDHERFLSTNIPFRKISKNDSFEQFKYGDAKFWIKLWHNLYAINLYVSVVTEDSDYVRMNRYEVFIEELINNLEQDVKNFFLFRKLPLAERLNLNQYSKVIRAVLDGESSVDKWQKIWKVHERACIKVAQAVSYTSYFELREQRDFPSHNLKTDRIWDKFYDIGTPDEEIKRLKTIGELLKTYIAKPNFSTVHDIVAIVSELNTRDVKKHIQLRWSGLSSGELALLKSFSRLFLAKKELEKESFRGVDGNSWLLLLDEVDLGLHPEWQRRWVSVALPVIEKIFEGKHLQIIMTTHSPIILSDIYQENVLLLGKDGQEVKGIDKTFGQNIYSLFKDSFFLKKMMGDHTYTRIEETMAFLHHKLGNLKAPLPETNSYHALSEEQQKIWVEKIIASVGEPIIANQLRDLYERAYAEKSEEDRIRAEIRRLQKQLENLRGGDNHDAS